MNFVRRKMNGRFVLEVHGTMEEKEFYTPEMAANSFYERFSEPLRHEYDAVQWEDEREAAMLEYRRTLIGRK